MDTDVYDFYDDTVKFSLATLVNDTQGLTRAGYKIKFGVEPHSNLWVSVESELCFSHAIDLFRRLGISPETEFEALTYGNNHITNMNVFDVETRAWLRKAQGCEHDYGTIVEVKSSDAIWQKTQLRPYRMKDLDTDFLRIVDRCTEDIFFGVTGNAGSVKGILFCYFQGNYPQSGQDTERIRRIQYSAAQLSWPILNEILATSPVPVSTLDRRLIEQTLYCCMTVDPT